MTTDGFAMVAVVDAVTGREVCVPRAMLASVSAGVYALQMLYGLRRVRETDVRDVGAFVYAVAPDEEHVAAVGTLPSLDAASNRAQRGVFAAAVNYPRLRVVFLLAKGRPAWCFAWRGRVLRLAPPALPDTARAAMHCALLAHAVLDGSQSVVGVGRLAACGVVADVPLDSQRLLEVLAPSLGGAADIRVHDVHVYPGGACE